MRGQMRLFLVALLALLAPTARVDAALVFADAGHRPEKKFYCLPRSGLAGEQGLRIIDKYLRDNPAQLHQGAAWAVISAFREVFPCPR